MHTMSKAKRLEQLERAAQPGERNPLADLSLPELMAHLEQLLEMEDGSLPRSVEECTARGYSSMAEALSAELGITSEQLKRYLSTGALEPENR